MNHQDVKNLQREINDLIRHCVEKKVDNFHLNYGLDKNATRLNAATAEINKGVSQELKDLEIKAQELAQPEIAKLEEKDKIEINVFAFGVKLLNEKEQARHAELMDAYNLAMQEENELELYMLDPDKLQGITIEFPFYLILKNFLPKEIDQK